MHFSSDLPEALELWAPAKINLFLAVTGRRADGYHDLFTLMCAISLFDRLTLRFGGRASGCSAITPRSLKTIPTWCIVRHFVFLSAWGTPGG